MTAATFSELEMDHIGQDATETDLAEFVSLCEQLQEIRPESSEAEVIEELWGNGDYYRNAKRLGLQFES